MTRSALLVPSVVLAAIVAGLAGYLVIGQPQLPSAHAPAVATNTAIASEAEQASAELLASHGDARAWLTLSDALIRGGQTAAAVDALQSALAASPRDVNLWVQLGVALVAHAEGEMVPAARLAFDRASVLDPDHPAPRFYLGLAFLQSGDASRALAVWEPLMAVTPPDAAWKTNLERQIDLARRMQQMQAATGGKQP